MAYKLDLAEPLPVDLKRVAREELDSALAHLRGEGGADAEKRVHEARKSFKKVRALLRLIRAELGDKTYRRENDCLREAGRRLSAVRDAEVLVQTATDLREHATGDARKALTSLSRALERRRTDTVRATLDDGSAVAEVAEIVTGVRGRIDGWPLDHDRADVVAKGLKRAHGRGAGARKRAFKKGGAEDFHEWRKRVKDLWYHGRLLRPADPDGLGSLVDRADELADVLGLDHDLAVLGAEIDALGTKAGNAAARRGLHALIGRRRFELQRRAHLLGRRLYCENAKSFASRITATLRAARVERAAGGAVWVTPADAERARELLRAKARADAPRKRRINTELRELGVDGDDFDELVARGVVRVGDATDLDRLMPEQADALPEANLDIGANEASGICPIGSARLLEEYGWQHGFWLALDEVPVNEGIVAVGSARGSDGADGWEGKLLEFRVDGDAASTEDAEDCLRRNGWVYLIGSHYGSKEGPIELERQFVARFREDDATGGAEPPTLEVAHTAFLLHRAVNDALAEAEVELFPLAAAARDALVGAALENGTDGDAAWADQIRAEDLPINIEGCASRPGGGFLLGLRFPCSAAGQPLIVELEGVEPLFEDPPAAPSVRGVWVLEGVGHAAAPAGVRGLDDLPDGTLHVLTGSLDSTGKGSALIDAHPEGALARSAHFRTRLPARRRSGRVKAELVREFPGLSRVEGVATDPTGRLFYVSDEEERIHLRFADAAG